LRMLGLRAHHVKEIYTYANSLVETARNNGGKRSVLRKLTARIGKYYYKLDLDNIVLTLKLHNGYEAKLRLVAPSERVVKYKEWSNYELVVKYDSKNFWVSVYFKKTVKPVKHGTIIAVDLNFDNLTLAVFMFNSKLIRLKRYRTPLRKMLTHKIWIERVQKRYPESWKFIKNVRRTIERPW